MIYGYLWKIIRCHSPMRLRKYKLSPRQIAKVRKRWRKMSSVARNFMTPLTYIFKSWGIHCLNFLIYDQKRPEGPKHVIRKSFCIGMSRCAVHMLPAAFCILIVYFNRLGIFIGPGFSVGDKSDGAYLIAFQIAAKILELLSIASMCTILLQVLRQDLLYGEGIPIGLLTSHLWCAKPQSIFSPEYISAAQKTSTDCFGTLKQLFGGRWVGFKVICWHFRQLRLLILISFAILVATLIGPFSAVLLLPRLQFFGAGGTDFNLNATSTELWPAVVTSDLELDVCSSNNATTYPVCPSGGYRTTRDHWSLFTLYDSDGYRPSVEGSSIGWASYTSYDPWGIFPKMIGLGNDRNAPIGGYMPTVFAQANAYTAIMSQTLLRDWQSAAREAEQQEETHHGPLQSARSFVHAEMSAGVVSRHPITSVRCSEPQNLSASANTFEFRRFKPDGLFIDSSSWGDDNNTIPVDISGLQRHPMSHLRTQWVDLPTEIFGPVSTGFLFEMPWSATNTSRITIGCTVAAAWCTSVLSFSLYTVQPDWASCEDRPTRMLSDEEDVAWEYYNRHVALDHSWLDLLTPKAPNPLVSDSNWQPSTLDMIFEAAGYDTLIHDLRSYPFYIWLNDTCNVGRLDPNLTDLELWNGRVCQQADKTVFVERTVARVITDGLSRRLSHRAFDMLPELRSWIVTGLPRTENYNKKLIDVQRRENAIEMSTDPTRLSQTLNIQVYGFGYGASTKTDDVAIGVVCAYVAISVLHVVWTIWSRKSSSSWESSLELILLAWNSPPIAALRATSAQIHRWKTYQHVAKIVATVTTEPATPGVTRRHLRLVVEESPESESSAELTSIESRGSEQQTLVDSQSEQIDADKKYY